MRLPSPSLAVSILALVVATSGTSYAVTQLPKNSVGAKQIAPGAVGGSEVKDGSLQIGDFATGQLPAGAPGPAGPAGAAGPAGQTGQTGQTGARGPAGTPADVSQFFSKLESDARYAAGSSVRVDAGYKFVPPYSDGSSTQVLQAGDLIGGSGMALSVSLCSIATGGRPVSESRLLVGLRDVAAPGTSGQPKEFMTSYYDGTARVARKLSTGSTAFFYAGEGLGAGATATGSNLVSTFTIDAASSFDRTFVIHVDGTVRWSNAGTTGEPNGCHVTAVATKSRVQP